jgi:CheY-like chemotaxis protein
MIQTAIDAINSHFASPEIWRHPSIGSALMQVAGGIARVTRELVPDTSEEAAKPRILLVDDAQDVLVTVGAFLTKEGYLVLKAPDGEQALQLIANDPSISLLVSDFAMPGLNGADLIAQALELRSELKALVITAYPMADGLRDMSPRAAILTKPFRRDALIATVGILLHDQEETGKPAVSPDEDAHFISGEVRPSVENEARGNAVPDIPARTAVDFLAEGMWRWAAGATCQETWGILPEDQRIWWRDCAREAVRSWEAMSLTGCWTNR